MNIDLLEEREVFFTFYRGELYAWCIIDGAPRPVTLDSAMAAKKNEDSRHIVQLS